MKSKKKTRRQVAGIVIHQAGDMTASGRKDIALWLRRCSDHMLKHGDNYAKKFTAKFNYVQG